VHSLDIAAVITLAGKLSHCAGKRKMAWGASVQNGLV
jgi:hypothetical protein